MKRILLPLLAGLAVLVSGCATITGTETQSISLQAVDTGGAPVADAECKLSNDKGSWRAKPPAIAVVMRSAEDLMVQCEAEGLQPGILRAISRANSGMAGNIIFGGGIGALIDHNKGTAYDYPYQLRVVFGTSQVVDKANEPSSPLPAPSSPPPAVAGPPPDPPPSPPAGAPRSSAQPVTLDDLKDLLPK
jgi:hypothetical protein